MAHADRPMMTTAAAIRTRQLTGSRAVPELAADVTGVAPAADEGGVEDSLMGTNSRLGRTLGDPGSMRRVTDK